MVVYNFKKMTPVPTAEAFVDIALQRTQRKTPTVVRPGYNITRIRHFYMRKVKFTQQTFSERISQIVNDFPRLDDIHPFYADLMNVLYDRDHYKLALGQINTARTIIDNIARDYVKLLKYGDSLYRCKQLKRAALGRMCTVMKKHKASLAYLEEVRKHMSRLPALDPNTRTLICTGYPNVGKSSFLNKVTRADVDVQPYAFTTKALFVGHMDYRYLRWQVIDTPGLLDTPLEGKNTIEMQAITALAHLQATVLFFVDVSEQCGFTVPQQIALFRSIRPLFANKQLVVVCNKLDVKPWEEVPADQRAEIEAMVAEAGPAASLLHMSVKEGTGVMAVRNAACDKLLQARVDQKLSGRRLDSNVQRLTIAMPKKRDGVTRGANIPESVLRQREAMDTADKGARRTEKDIMWENGGPGVYKPDYRKHWRDLEDDAWRYDAVPDIMDGKNVFDFVDPDIAAKLAELEAEEEQLLEEEAARPDTEAEALDAETAALHEAIQQTIDDKRQTRRREKAAAQHRGPVSRNSRARRTTAQAMERDLDAHAVPTDGAVGRVRSAAQEEDDRGRKRTRGRGRDSAEGDDGEEMDVADAQMRTKKRRAVVVGRDHSVGPARDRTVMGMKSSDDAKKVAKRAHKELRRKMARDRRAGDADRHSGPKLVKWQNSGKMSLGTRNSR